MTESKKKRLSQHDADVVAEKNYEVTDYKGSSTLQQGLAKTHEQVSDTYVEGTIDGEIEDYQGKDINLSRDGFEEK